MASRLSVIREDRIKKLNELKKLGINPYPSKPQMKLFAISFALRNIGKQVSVGGRLGSLRAHGNILFTDLSDESGKIQLLFQKKQLGEKFKTLKLIDSGDFLATQGKVIKTQSEEITIDVDEYQILTKAIRPLPSEWFGLKDEEERYRQRYVDLLLNEDVRRVFEIRTKIIKAAREFLDEHGFIEVETPVLQPIYGGATALPFVTYHKSLGYEYYLRISDELYLKRLIVGGFEKVYEIGKDFRNEGIDRQHNPEFTQLEFYWAYADYEDGMRFTEKFLEFVLKKAIGTTKIKYQGKELDFGNIKRMTFRDLVFSKTKIDIDRATNEEDLRKEMKDKKLKIDLKGIVGYGALIDKVYKQYARPTVVEPTFLSDYPVDMIALAKRHPKDERKIASFQLLASGFELIKAYNELNDPIDQEARWKLEEKLGEKGLEEHMVIDQDYIRALEFGMPPTFGWGMGIDRITAMVTNQPSLKDIILFPTLRPENK